MGCKVLQLVRLHVRLRDSVSETAPKLYHVFGVRYLWLWLAVIFSRQCNMLYTSDFVDYTILAHTVRARTHE